MKMTKKILGFALAVCMAATSFMLPQTVTTKQAEAAKEKTYSNAYFSITVPASWAGKYTVYQSNKWNGIGFCSKKCYEESKGNMGTLFSVVAYTDDSYKEMPDYTILKKSGSQTYVKEEPTDVQYDGLSKAAIKEYSSLFKDRDKICATLKVTAPPKKAALKSVKNVSGKKAKVALEAKVAGAAGYEVAYATSKKFTGAKSKFTNKTAVTITKLKAGKTYYFRTRAYKTVNGKKIYSAWSRVKNIVIKK